MATDRLSAVIASSYFCPAQLRVGLVIGPRLQPLNPQDVRPKLVDVRPQPGQCLFVFRAFLTHNVARRDVRRVAGHLERRRSGRDSLIWPQEGGLKWPHL